MYFGTKGLKLGQNFVVTPGGILTAVSGHFSGEITADSGKIGSWTIDHGALKSEEYTDKSGTYHIEIGADGTIQCVLGKNNIRWKIANNGTATFSGKLTAEDISITGGSMTGGNIGGKASMTGGSIGGGGYGPSIGSGTTISTADVHTSDGKTTLDKWCEDIVAKTVTAEYIAGKLTSIDLLTINTSLSFADGAKVYPGDSSVGQSGSIGPLTFKNGFCTGGPSSTGADLDADTLDGHDSTYFATADHTHTGYISGKAISKQLVTDVSFDGENINVTKNWITVIE